MVYTQTFTQIRFLDWNFVYCYLFDLDTETSPLRKDDESSRSNKANKLLLDDNYVKKIIQFGRELFQASHNLDQADRQANEKILRVRFNSNNGFRTSYLIRIIPVPKRIESCRTLPSRVK